MKYILTERGHLFQAGACRQSGHFGEDYGHVRQRRQRPRTLFEMG
jgi:hypothetical protein